MAVTSPTLAQDIEDTAASVTASRQGLSPSAAEFTPQRQRDVAPVPPPATVGVTPHKVFVAPMYIAVECNLATLTLQELYEQVSEQIGVPASNFSLHFNSELMPCTHDTKALDVGIATMSTITFKPANVPAPQASSPASAPQVMSPINVPVPTGSNLSTGQMKSLLTQLQQQQQHLQQQKAQVQAYQMPDPYEHQSRAQQFQQGQLAQLQYTLALQLNHQQQVQAAMQLGLPAPAPPLQNMLSHQQLLSATRQLETMGSALPVTPNRNTSASTPPGMKAHVGLPPHMQLARNGPSGMSPSMVGTPPQSIHQHHQHQAHQAFHGQLVQDPRVALFGGPQVHRSPHHSQQQHHHMPHMQQAHHHHHHHQQLSHHVHAHHHSRHHLPQPQSPTAYPNIVTSRTPPSHRQSASLSPSLAMHTNMHVNLPAPSSPAPAGGCINLSAVAGKFSTFALSPSGSQALVDALKAAVSSPAWLETVVDTILQNLDDFVGLVTHKHATDAVRELVEVSTPAQREKLLEAALPDLIEICDSNYGCEVLLQLVGRLADGPAAVMLINKMGEDVVTIMTSHTARKLFVKVLMRRYAQETMQPLYDAVLHNLLVIARESKGCVTMKRLVDLSTPEYKICLYNRILECSELLIPDQYGNYLIQHVIDSPETAHVVAEKIAENMVANATNKMASHVIERCTQMGTAKTLALLVGRILDPDCLPRIIKDQYGNYIVQDAIEKAPANLVIAIKNAVAPYVGDSQFGHKIEQKINRRLKWQTVGSTEAEMSVPQAPANIPRPPNEPEDLPPVPPLAPAPDATAELPEETTNAPPAAVAAADDAKPAADVMQAAGGEADGVAARVQLVAGTDKSADVSDSAREP
ncbi:Pumilio domain-containing protein C6G9.14 [Diplonema papillatum]|nr:Pumilio domain-containing protein C6G9.14 [Diplonema papillatum]